MATLLITYNRLDVTERDAENIVGDDYRAVDAVEALAGGRGMEEGVIYHFTGMGSSTVIPRQERRMEREEYPAEQSRGIAGLALRERTEEFQVARFIDRVSSHPDVLSVCECRDRVYPARWNANLDNAGDSCSPPDGTEWNLTTINANGVNAARYSGLGRKIAILDTGIARHTDLNVVGGVSFCEGLNDFQSDPYGHGTHCAGIAAGQRGGVAKGADLYSIKVADTTGAHAPEILAGLGWALRNEMNVVSISLAGAADLTQVPAIANAVQALMAINCVVVASTGESGGDVAFPANTSGIIAVGGCDKNLVILDGTCIGGNGNHLTVVAPATDITTTFHINDGYVQNFSGCSAAAPHVAGLAALIQQGFPGITPLQVISRILASAQPVRVGRNKMSVFGGATLIDCDEALSQSKYIARFHMPIGQRAVNTSIEVDVVSPVIGPGFPTHCTVSITNFDTRYFDTKRQKINGRVPALFTNVPPGRYYIVVVPEGGNASRMQIRTVDGTKDMTFVTFDLSVIDPVGRIIATVLVEGQRMPGKSVTVTGEDGKYFVETFTDLEGVAEFNSVPETQAYAVSAHDGSAIQTTFCDLTVTSLFETEFRFRQSV